MKEWIQICPKYNEAPPSALQNPWKEVAGSVSIAGSCCLPVSLRKSFCEIPGSLWWPWQRLSSSELVAGWRVGTETTYYTTYLEVAVLTYTQLYSIPGGVWEMCWCSTGIRIVEASLPVFHILFYMCWPWAYDPCPPTQLSVSLAVLDLSLPWSPFHVLTFVPEQEVMVPVVVVIVMVIHGWHQSGRSQWSQLIFLVEI